MRFLAALIALGSVVSAAAQEPTLYPSAPPPPPPTIVGGMPPLHPAPPDDIVQRWHRTRVVSVIGSLTSIIGTGLSLSSIIYIGVTHYPPSAGDLLGAPAKPSDTGPVLAYLGSSVSAASFVLTAGALGYEHHLLDELGADPGRGRFGVGTAFGLVGLVGIGAGYFFGLTNYLNPHDQGVAIIATSISGAALCTIASILYASDSSRLKSAWRNLTTF
jgi:hypothetical protein